MKKIYLFVTFLLLSSFVFGQIAYYDALTIKKSVILNPNDTSEYIIRASEKKLVLEILGKYIHSSTDNITFNDILDKYSTNPFIGKKDPNSNPHPFIHLIGGDYGTERTETDTYSKSIISKIGGLDVTNIADGLAKFMVERTKKELNAYFFEAFKYQVENSVELQTLFPQTALHLSAIGSEIYNYNAYIGGLRESFEFDLSNLFIHTPKLLDTPRYKEATKNMPELRYIVKTGFYIINELDKNVHPGDILHQFPQQFGTDKAPTNLYNGVLAVDLFSQSLRSKSDKRYWISTDSLQLLNDPVIFRIYLGLLYQQTPINIKFTYKNNGTKEEIIFKDEFKKLGVKINEFDQNSKIYRQFIQNFGLKLAETETALKKLNSPAHKNNPDPKDLYTYLQGVIGLIDYSAEIKNLPYIESYITDKNDVFQSTRKYTFITGQASKIYINAAERNYGTAIINLIPVLDSILTDQVIENIEKIVIADYNKNVASLSKDDSLYKSKKKFFEKDREAQIETLKNLNQKVLRYGSFMASIVQAESSDQVKTIIEATAMPAGSFRVKRESNYNVSLNGFLGVFGGYEFIENLENTMTPNNIALSAPVGISITKGSCTWFTINNRNQGKGLAHGLFISIIDIGALASFRFADDSSQVASDVELKQILAPGIFYSIHFRNSPLTLSAGVQMGPLLREVTATEFKTEDNFYWRAGISLLVDIPLLNLYNRKE